MEKKADQEKNIADKIWEEIKDLKLEMFALPNQFVHAYYKPIAIEPTKLYLLLNTPAALPALELAVQGKYSVERLERYICVSPLAQKI